MEPAGLRPRRRAGARVSDPLGSHHEWPDRRMHEVLGEHIERGWIQLFCLDQVHDESWYGEHLHPGARAWRHLQYDRYLHDEVLPFTASEEPQPVRHHHRGELRRLPRRLLRLPASGPGQPDHRDERAVRHQATDRRLLRRQRLRLQPSDFMRHEHDPARLDGLPAAGHHPGHRPRRPVLREQPRASRRRSGSKGIGNALRIWDGWAHDWPYWERMIRLYIGGHD